MREDDEWIEQFRNIRRERISLNDETISQHFPNVANKSFDNNQGFGYLTEGNQSYHAKVIVDETSPFIDYEKDAVSEELQNMTPYSSVYNVDNQSDSSDKGKTILIFRHNVQVSSLSDDIKNSIQFVATNKGDQVPPMNQMSQVVKANDLQGSVPSQKQFVVTVHKASNLHKKGIAGKADPYVILTLGSQKFKSPVVSNSQNPVWHFTAIFDVDEQAISQLTMDMEVYDSDTISKDDFLGSANIQLQDVIASNDNIVNNWIDLQNCKSGKIQVSAKYVSLEPTDNEIGKLKVTVHQAKKIEKASMIRSSDPYMVVKLGTQLQKSKVVKSNRNPAWGFTTTLYVLKNSPEQCTFEVFDEDIGKDAPLGNFVLDTSTLITRGVIGNFWVPLENCKSGEVLVSTEFIPSEGPQVEVEQTYVENKQEVESVQFINPLYLDDEYAVVEGFNLKWFMAVAKSPNLPIKARLVPFKVLSDPAAPVHVFCLPGEGNDLIRKVMKQYKPIEKCGYEKHVVLSNGVVYEFPIEDDITGRIEVRTWGVEEQKFTIQIQNWEGKDFIETKMIDVGSGHVTHLYLRPNLWSGSNYWARG